MQFWMRERSVEVDGETGDFAEDERGVEVLAEDLCDFEGAEVPAAFAGQNFFATFEAVGERGRDFVAAVFASEDDAGASASAGAGVRVGVLHFVIPGAVNIWSLSRQSQSRR